MAEADPRFYHRRDVIAFRKTNEPFGGLSNMAPGFPVKILDVKIGTVEALYQACRFPHIPHVQQLIISQASPMTAKMRSKPYRKDSRPDWDTVRVAIMKWCLRVKLLQNWAKFSALLLETGDRPIVEDSRKDDFWGAIPNHDGTLQGRNVLGRLLMELRDKLKTDPEQLEHLRPVPIAQFLLFSQPIVEISRAALDPIPHPAGREVTHLSLPLDVPRVAEGCDAAPAPAGTPIIADEQPEPDIYPVPSPPKGRDKLVWIGVSMAVLALAVYALVT